jgi:hypothetical protein
MKIYKLCVSMQRKYSEDQADNMNFTFTWLGDEEVQSMPHQDILLWYRMAFELKATGNKNCLYLSLSLSLSI